MPRHTLNKRYRSGMECDLFVSDLTPTWTGLGELEAGVTVEVPGGVPGDRLRVRILSVSQHRPHIFGELVQLYEPSSLRVESLCSVFPRCFGCPGITFAYTEQLARKTRRLHALFPGAGVVSPSPETLGYRTKSKWVTSLSTPLGGYAHKSHEVIDLQHCPVTHPRLVDLYSALKPWAASQERWCERRGSGFLRALFSKVTSQGEVQLAFVLGRRPTMSEEREFTRLAQELHVESLRVNIHPEKTNALVGKEEYTVYGPSALLEQDHLLPYPVNATAFSQINHGVARVLYRRITALVPPGTRTALDLYAGNGPIAFALTAIVPQVVALERVPHAVALGAAQKTGVRFVCQEVEEGGTLRRLLRQLSPDLVVLNPPRSGLRGPVHDLLASALPSTLIYMSCNPQTLKRDVDLLADIFTPDLVEGYDMFPHTPHFETLVRLRAKSGVPPQLPES